MPVARRVIVLSALAVMACCLSGCGSISSFLAGGMGDLIPAWAGGLPADAPPRPGTPEYDAYLLKHGKSPTPGMTGPDPALSPSADAVH